MQVGITAAKNQAQVREEERKTLIGKLSDLTFSFPIQSKCFYCNCEWLIPDFSQMERVWSHSWSQWRVGFCCPACHKTNLVFKDMDFEIHAWPDGKHFTKADKEYYERLSKYEGYRCQLRDIQDMFRKAPWWKSIYRWARHIDWKIQNRQKPVYLNDKKFKQGLVICAVDVVQSEDEDKPLVAKG